MSDEARQLVKATATAALFGALAGVVTFWIIYIAGGLEVGAGPLGRGPGRLVMACAGVTGLAIPRVTEWITGVCGPVMWVPVVAGGFAGSLVLNLACAGFGVSLAGLLIGALAAYLVTAAISIAFESAR